MDYFIIKILDIIDNILSAYHLAYASILINYFQLIMLYFMHIHTYLIFLGKIILAAIL